MGQDDAVCRNAAARRQHGDHLGDAEQAERHDRQRKAVEQIGLTEGEAEIRCRRGWSHDPQKQAETGRSQTLDTVLADHAGGEIKADDGEHEQFRRAQREHDRPGDRNGDKQDDGAHDAADHGGQEADAERPGRLALLGQSMTFDCRWSRCRRSRRADQDRGDGIGRIDDGNGAQKQRQAGKGIHQIDERQKDRDCRDAAKAGQHAEHHPGDHAGKQRQQPHRLKQDFECDRGVFKHSGRAACQEMEKSKHGWSQ